MYRAAGRWLRCVVVRFGSKSLVALAQRKHPSALGSFDQIAAAAKGKRVVMFMDYDGTLSPIVADPDMAFMTPEVTVPLCSR